jgi:hypothetical protein
MRQGGEVDAPGPESPVTTGMEGLDRLIHGGGLREGQSLLVIRDAGAGDDHTLHHMALANAARGGFVIFVCLDGSTGDAYDIIKGLAGSRWGRLPGGVTMAGPEGQGRWSAKDMAISIKGLTEGTMEVPPLLCIDAVGCMIPNDVGRVPSSFAIAHELVSLAKDEGVALAACTTPLGGLAHLGTVGAWFDYALSVGPAEGPLGEGAEGSTLQCQLIKNRYGPESEAMPMRWRRWQDDTARLRPMRERIAGEEDALP